VFTFQARTPKDTGALSFKAYQIYQGGETVEWIGASGSARPAAQVVVTGKPAAQVAGDSHSVGGGAPAETAKPAGETGGSPGAPVAAPGSDPPLFAGLATGVVAFIELVLSGVALARRPRTA
jgi:hypothetical protein